VTDFSDRQPDGASTDWRALLGAAAAAAPGWSTPYGGPEGVAVLAAELRRQLDDEARLLSALRAVAVAELLRERSMANVGESLGISKAAVQKINAAAGRRGPFYNLLASGDW
jgi:hypothetical protein